MGVGALHISWASGRSIRMGIDIQDVGIRNGIYFPSFAFLLLYI